MWSLRNYILCFVVLIAFVTENCECLNETNTEDVVKEYDDGDITVEEKVNEEEFMSGESEEGPLTESRKALEDRLVHGLYHFSKTGEMTKQLNHDLGKVQKFKGISKAAFKKNQFVEEKKGMGISEFTFCTLCQVVAKILLTYRQLGGSKGFASTALKTLCYQMESKKVCDGLIDLNIDIFLYIMDKKPNITTAKICNIIAQSYNCKDSKDDNVWSVYIPRKASNNPEMMPTKREGNCKPLRILHITDIHYDFKYKAGANTKCGEPVCCGVDQGKPKTPELAAGYWGDYRSCDMPLYAIENLMDAASKHDVDFIYHTGDIINHRIWETTKKTNTKSILEIYELFRTKFPNKTVYHLVGNHESHPLNQFARQDVTRSDLGTHWLYELLAKEWSTWLPKTTQQSIRRGGFYTVSMRPGFRIIALNSNVCYVYNWWLLYSDVDTYGQLQWLSDTLFQAELDNEVVHILTHVPSGDKECYKKWSHEYNRIIQRFAHIVKAQFVGHTHYNELHFYYEKNKEDPVNVAFNGGSFATYIDVNPNFRIYEVNPDTYQIEDYQDWIYNITEANIHGKSVPPKWYSLGSFKEAYGLSSMDLPELGKLVRSFATNSTQLNTYTRLRVRDGDASLKSGCNQKCKERLLCSLVTSEFGDVERCEKLVSEFKEANSLK